MEWSTVGGRFGMAYIAFGILAILVNIVIFACIIIRRRTTSSHVFYIIILNFTIIDTIKGRLVFWSMLVFRSTSFDGNIFLDWNILLYFSKAIKLIKNSKMFQESAPCYLLSSFWHLTWQQMDPCGLYE